MRPTFCLSFFLDLLLSFFSSFFHSFLSIRISAYIEYHQKLSNLRNVSLPSTFSFTFEFIESISLFLFLGLSLKFLFVPSTRRFSQSEYSYSRLEGSEQCICIFLLFSFFFSSFSFSLFIRTKRRRVRKSRYDFTIILCKDSRDILRIDIFWYDSRTVPHVLFEFSFDLVEPRASHDPYTSLSKPDVKGFIALGIDARDAIEIAACVLINQPQNRRSNSRWLWYEYTCTCTRRACVVWTFVCVFVRTYIYTYVRVYICPGTRMTGMTVTMKF